MNHSFRLPDDIPIKKDANSLAFGNNNKPKTNGKRRTRYAVTPDKYNIIELQRKSNNIKHKSFKTPKHCEELYKLDGVRKKAREDIIKAKESESEKITYSFKPEIDKTSERIMKNSKEELISRNLNWLHAKEEKINKQKSLQKKHEEEKETQIMNTTLDLPKANIQVNSRVKEYLETSGYKRRPKSNINKDKDYSPMSFNISQKNVSYYTSQNNY